MRIVTGASIKPWGEKRNADCPLIELPNHGDLIERDALKEDMADKCDCETLVGIEEAIKCADSAPVVIPSERSEE